MITFNIERTLDDSDIGSPEFNHVYQLTVGDERGNPFGYVTDQRADGRPWGYAPDVTTLDIERGDDTSNGDIEIMTTDRSLPKWEALVGHTGQYGYNGAVQHPSEQWSRCHVEDLIRLADDGHGLYFAIVEVRDEDGGFADGDPIGWAVVYSMINP